MFLFSINYDQGKQRAYVESNLSLLTSDQQEVYDSFCSMIDGDDGGMLFLDAPDGTGKTFLINFILAKLRSEGKIALATASSGIAAALSRHTTDVLQIARSVFTSGLLLAL